jgi:hypothetical protein
MEVPASVAQWFSWCNGVEIRSGQLQDDVSVIPGYSLVSIEEAVRIMPSYYGDLVLGERWLPLLATAGGDIYAAVWRLGGEAEVAGVLVGESTEVEFSSIEQMVSVLNACFEREAFLVDGQGRLVMNSDRYEEVYTEVTST